MKRKDHLLTILILAGLVGGIIVGQFLLFDPGATGEALRQATQPWQDFGDLIFIRPLRMMIIPLIFVSVVVGVTSIADPQKLGLVGGATILFYVTTMLFAVVLGLTIVNVVKPGAAVEDVAALVDQGAQAFAEKEADIERGSAEGIGGAFMNLLHQMVPTNPVRAAVEGNTLGVVVFSILLGLALVLTGEPAQPVIRLFDGVFEALLKLVTWIIWIAPLGVFLLVAGRVGEVGLSSLAGPVGLYMVCVLLGLLIHAVVTLPLLCWLAGRVNPFRYLWQMRKPLITAFSTASSRRPKRAAGAPRRRRASSCPSAPPSTWTAPRSTRPSPSSSSSRCTATTSPSRSSSSSSSPRRSPPSAPPASPRPDWSPWPSSSPP